MIQMSEKVKKGIAGFMAISMMFHFVPQSNFASAAEQNIKSGSRQTQMAAGTKNIVGLGTEGIASAETPQRNTSDWKGSYVWYGKHIVS